MEARYEIPAQADSFSFRWTDWICSSWSLNCMKTLRLHPEALCAPRQAAFNFLPGAVVGQSSSAALLPHPGVRYGSFPK